MLYLYMADSSKQLLKTSTAFKLNCTIKPRSPLLDMLKHLAIIELHSMSRILLACCNFSNQLDLMGYLAWSTKTRGEKDHSGCLRLTNLLKEVTCHHNAQGCCNRLPRHVKGCVALLRDKWIPNNKHKGLQQGNHKPVQTC